MKVIEAYKNFPENYKKSVLAIGNFDGVHKGHREVLNQVIRKAKEASVPSGAMVFNPHPRAFFTPDVPIFYLTDLYERRRLFEDLGLDFICEVPFDKDFSKLTHEQFVDYVLGAALDASHIFVGYNFFFGKGRGGDPSFLKERGRELGMDVTIVSAQGQKHAIYSSTAIREALIDGNIKQANEALGRRWAVNGKVIHGAGRGSGLGFPTANVRLYPGCHLAHGIYAVFVTIEGKQYQAAAYFGKRPSFDNGPVELEVFLFDFDGDLYGDEIRIEFVDFIRPDMKIDDVDALKAQMDDDCQKVKAVLSAS